MRRALLVMALALAAVPAVYGATPEQIVAKLNAQRAANGIPGPVALNPRWTTGCRHHVRYEQLNGIQWTHEEVAGKPGFTQDGRLAALDGDQAYASNWSNGNPFQNLPLHLANLLAPTLAQVGAYEAGRRSCVSVADGGTRRFGSDALYTYPGDGRTGVAVRQVVRGEWPHSPGDVVGLPQDRPTGPTIYVFSVGPWTDSRLELMRAALTGPGGPVAIRVVDPRAHPEIDPYVAPGVFFLIPVAPLAAGTRYQATVTVSGGGDSQTKTWSFRTG